MTSFRRVAFPLGFAAILGGALLFSLSTARGQSAAPSAPPGASSPGAMSGSGNSATGNSAVGGSSSGAALATTGAPTLPQTIGVSPVFPIRQGGNKSFIVLGGTGNDNYDLQIENLYSLLRERGVPIPNVLHPLSTAKPSFIIEKLIVLASSNSATSTQGGGSAGPSLSAPSSPASPAQGTAAGADSGGGTAYSVAVTLRGIERIINAEFSRGTGRLGGAHRSKLLYLSRAVHQLVEEAEGAIKTEQLSNTAQNELSKAESSKQIANMAANDARHSTTVKDLVNNANVSKAFQNNADEAQGRALSAANAAIASTAERPLLEAQARVYARNADRYTPNIP